MNNFAPKQARQLHEWAGHAESTRASRRGRRRALDWASGLTLVECDWQRQEPSVRRAPIPRRFLHLDRAACLGSQTRLIVLQVGCRSLQRDARNGPGPRMSLIPAPDLHLSAPTAFTLRHDVRCSTRAACFISRTMLKTKHLRIHVLTSSVAQARVTLVVCKTRRAQDRQRNSRT